MNRHVSSQSAAFSLVLSLVVLTLVALLIVAFLSATMLDRSSSRAILNKSVAESAAQSGMHEAMSLVVHRITDFPDSATVWERIESPPPEGAAKQPTPTAFEGTVLYMNDGPNDPLARRRILPLVSRPDDDGNLLEDLPIERKAECLGSEPWTNENSIDLNRPLSNSDPTGWIGTPPDGVRRQYRARWIDIKGATQPDGHAPVVARYAFWVEDESFRLNLNLLSEVVRGSEIEEDARYAAWRATHPSAAFHAARQGPMQGLLHSLQAPGMHDEMARGACRLRERWFGQALWDLRAFNHADPNYDLGDRAKFLGTIHSGALNLSRHGTQRVNLNGIVGVDAPGFHPSLYKPSDADILRQLSQIYEAVRFHTSDATGTMKFGQRFYRTSFSSKGAPSNLNAEQVTPEHQNLYLHKLAANIRDYIDPDFQPTIVRVSPAGEAAIGQRPPTNAINANAPPAEIWAQGKDSAPFLQEAVVRYRSSVEGQRYSLRVDYYIEFWNMGAKDVYVKEQPDIAEPHSLDGNVFVRIANQQAWVASPSGARLRSDNLPAGDPIQAVERDLVIDLTEGVFRNGQPVPSGVVFKAGQCTVITTDPDYMTPPRSGASSPLFSGGYNRENIYYCSKLRGSGKRAYTGSLQNPSDRGIRPVFRDGTQDYDTEVILGNDLGVIDSHPAAVAMGGSAIVTTASAPRDDWYGGSLLGNGTTRSQLGDPRTNNEQIDYVRFSGTSLSEPDQGRYWNTVKSPRFSLGYPNELYVNPHFSDPPRSGWTQWPDYYKGWDQTFSGFVSNQPTHRNAPAWIADKRLRSIGQLGDVFDPARALGNVGTLGITRARGGGRTLRMGQPDDLVDMSQWFTPSQQWASWRLADFFSVSNDLHLHGLININGARRDNGAALRAACHGLKLHVVSQEPSAASPTFADVLLDSDAVASPGIDAFLDEITARLDETDPSRPSYFRERGEVSELAVFNDTVPKLVGSTPMRFAFDRSREELLRRLIEMITTRGSVFTVYAVGQSVTQERNSPRLHVTGEHWIKATFALLPRREAGADFQTEFETFDPSSQADRDRRFSKPHHYDVQILQIVCR